MSAKAPKSQSPLEALVSRRRALADMGKTACGIALFGFGIGLYASKSGALPAMAIRPPGALPEDDFLAACTRCGICVRDCPYDILELARLGDDVATGTPYFTARTNPCEMCEDIPCIPNCPTGALDPQLTDIARSRMGLAVVVDQEACIAFQGLRCEVCFNICPVRGDAITIDYQANQRSGKHALFIPVVHSDACTGCGLCERACILQEAAIKVLPAHIAKGALGEHYRLGWQEREDAGGALVTPDQEHRYNLPEGMRYDHDGRGLIFDGAQGGPAVSTPDASMDGTPFSSNPLETLNRGIEEAR
ncbi:MAG: ferredoxin-type protein NapG [Rhodobacteraceae bacterium]|nr:ferredoxin-type protein NapG [Paracoccaceae bacterium]